MCTFKTVIKADFKGSDEMLTLKWVIRCGLLEE